MIDSILKYEIKQKLNNDRLYDDMHLNLEKMENELLLMCDSSDKEMTFRLKNIISSGGKRLRPTLAYFSHSASGKNNYPIIPLMCMLELMHTASLIHDDVVDDSKERRGIPTINKTNSIFEAVQFGDYLLAKAMEELHIYQGTGINEALAEVSGQMCLGEFAQMENRFNIRSFTKEDYYLQAKRKTAYLLAISCYTGALAGGMSQEEAQAFRSYGENLGIAFQLKDDLLDIKGGPTGKPQNQDIKRGIITLPILHLKELGLDKDILMLLEKKDKTAQEVDKIAKMVKKSMAFDHTEFVIRKFSKEAENALEKIEDCLEKDALINLARTLIKRKI